MKRSLGLLAGLVACLESHLASASEGAASYYFAGGFGTFLTAVPPEPGFTAASQTLLFGGQAQRAVLRGRATFGLSRPSRSTSTSRAPTPSSRRSWAGACKSAWRRR
jgi:hypothetical protein